MQEGSRVHSSWVSVDGDEEAFRPALGKPVRRVPCLSFGLRSTSSFPKHNTENKAFPCNQVCCGTIHLSPVSLHGCCEVEPAFLKCSKYKWSERWDPCIARGRERVASPWVLPSLCHQVRTLPLWDWHHLCKTLRQEKGSQGNEQSLDINRLFKKKQESSKLTREVPGLSRSPLALAQGRLAASMLSCKDAPMYFAHQVTVRITRSVHWWSPSGMSCLDVPTALQLTYA